MKKKIWYLLLLSLFSVFLLAGCGNKKEEQTAENNPNYDSSKYLSGLHYAIIDVDEYGHIYLELNADAAPATVTNFVNLVKEGFYDGLSFHRVIDGFMIQGGDPKANGTGTSKYTLPGEFAANGVENTISHTRGTISMARTEDYNSASCQFFIVHTDDYTSSLDGNYAAFGRVITGMDLVDLICEQTPVEDNNGTVNKFMQPRILSITMIEKEEAIFTPDDYYEDNSAQTGNQTANRPRSEAALSVASINSFDTIPSEKRYIMDENGDMFILSSSMDLLSLGIYTIDLSQGVTYGEDNKIVYVTNIAANDNIAIQLNVSREAVPNQLLVIEDQNEAVATYLLGFDATQNQVYLIPLM